MVVEDLDVKGMQESPEEQPELGTGGTFKQLLKYKCERDGTYFVTANPKAQPKRVHPMVSKPTNRCGYVRIPV